MDPDLTTPEQEVGQLPPRDVVTTWEHREEGGPYRCRLFHKPTGLTIESEPSSSAADAREQATSLLRKVLKGS